jgi:hypothetical protein
VKGKRKDELPYPSDANAPGFIVRGRGYVWNPEKRRSLPMNRMAAAVEGSAEGVASSWCLVDAGAFLWERYLSKF